MTRDTRTSTQSRRLVRSKGASWCLNWPSGAILLAYMQLSELAILLYLCLLASFRELTLQGS